ncbi:MAG: hypothetical protein RBS80_15700 [Thermoguttaceae bacterium]|jgi:hypothetical protein|nr:hypothetical protein [Thermoguttaceae bacterium]
MRRRRFVLIESFFGNWGRSEPELLLIVQVPSQGTDQDEARRADGHDGEP